MMEKEIQPLLIGNFLKIYSEELTADEIEFIGNVLLGYENENTDKILSYINEGKVKKVKTTIKKIIGE